MLISILTGLLTAFAVGGFQFWLEQDKRLTRYDALLNGVSSWFSAYLGEIRATAEALQPLTLSDCHDVVSELTSRAAFSMNVRAFLLVKGQNAICSSATGVMNVPMKDLVPDIDLNKATDMVVLGTPMMPDKPAIALWFRSPLLDDRGVFASLNINLTPYMMYSSEQPDLAGIAIGINDRAISTFTIGLIDLANFNQRPFRIAHVGRHSADAVSLRGRMAPEDVQFAALLGATVGMLMALLTAYVLYTRLRPGKEILTAIKREQFYGLPTRRECKEPESQRRRSADALETPQVKSRRTPLFILLKRSN